MSRSEGINGFVLAGGKSSRMGQDKGLMRLGNRPLVLRAAETLLPIVHTVTFLAPPDRYGNLGFPVIADLWPDQGPLSALCTGLISSDAEWNLFLACDLPRISPRFTEFLAQRVRATRSDAVVPRTQDGWQPLCAAYHARCRTAFEAAIRQGRRSIVELFDELHPEAITPEEMARIGLSEAEFANVNTPEEWTRLSQLLEGEAPSVTVPLHRVEGSHASRANDLLAVEEALEIQLGQRSLSITMRTPGNDLELAAGFLFSEGIIRDRADIRSLGRPSDGSPDIVTIELVEGERPAPVQAERNFLMTSACGVCGKATLSDLQVNSCPVLPQDDMQIAPATIHGLPDRLRQAQSVFDSTGGLHAAARFSLQGELESVREDVGRHNAVDKLVGAALLDHHLPLARSILLVSGRASFELVQKALMVGIPVMAAVGAPSSLAVATAERAGMTLIGFLRNNRFNVYTGKHRILGLELPR